ncbi:L,D-transpeptidase family protein [Sphingomicrobium sp. XHP0239]|uniref:L,D-transpeptidase family protein n=1 Tax=Sphingomicrobium maritimum TaxID=3133972 RepID=UPI0031CC41E8
MKTLAALLATAALALTTPATAANSIDTATSVSKNAKEVEAEVTYDASTTERTYFYNGVAYDYTAADVRITGDIAGGTNTLETHAARTEAAKQAERGFRDMKDKFGVSSISANKYRWDDDGASGDMRIVVSISKQLAFAYKGDTLVGAASVSTARDNKLTPQGIFPIWMKKSMHYSKAYDNTPMPYTQFIDKYGIALHAGPNPGYAASAGCVRLPKQFAKNIFSMTDIGSTVLIGA